MMSQRHIILSLVSSITNHETLITGSDIFLLSVYMHSVCNLARLFVQSYNNSCCFVVHPDIDRVITNFFNSLSDSLFNIRICFSTDLSKYHADRIFDCSLACNHRVRIFWKTSIKDGIRNIVTQFIRVTTGNTLRGEEKMSFFGSKMLFLH